MIRKFISIRFFIVLAFCILPLANRAAEKLEWLTEGDLKQERVVVVEAFKRAYKDISLETLNIGQSGSKYQTLKDFLNALVNEDQELLQKKLTSAFFVRAVHDDNKVVGYASFNIIELSEKGQEAYIRLLAIDPNFQKRGIGKKLVFSIIEKEPFLSRLYLVTRRFNGSAIRFYENIGFQKSNDYHEGNDPALYIGLERKM